MFLTKPSVSTLRSAIEVKNVFDQIQAAEKSGAPPEERKKLEEQAAEKVRSPFFHLATSRSEIDAMLHTQGLQALFKGTKLEIESILRETCDRILEQPGVSLTKLKLRAQALQVRCPPLPSVFANVGTKILGDAYSAARKEGGDIEDEYVRVDTRSSKAREGKA